MIVDYSSTAGAIRISISPRTGATTSSSGKRPRSQPSQRPFVHWDGRQGLGPRPVRTRACNSRPWTLAKSKKPSSSTSARCRRRKEWRDIARLVLHINPEKKADRRRSARGKCISQRCPS